MVEGRVCANCGQLFDPELSYGDSEQCDACFRKNPPYIICCETFLLAQRDESCSEYGSAIGEIEIGQYPNFETGIGIGAPCEMDLPLLKFCPWCGKKIEKNPAFIEKHLPRELSRAEQKAIIAVEAKIKTLEGEAHG